jgi:glycosyltransferase involved in cell wall biosynthesis
MMQGVDADELHVNGRSRAPRALVVTVVHHPGDSRIRHRQINALTRAGWDVTYAAPFSGYGASEKPVAGPGRLFTLDLPRSQGRKRLTAVVAARNLLRREAARHDIVLLHDPELVVSTVGLQLPPVVLDVHEDTAAAVGMKAWLPFRLHRVAARSVRRLEEFAERRHHLLLAEHAYAERFRRNHAVIPNSVHVKERVRTPDEPRVVYVGHLTRARGIVEMLELARLVHDRTAGELKVTLVGDADQESAALVRSAVDDGIVEWTGFLPSSKALDVVEGSIAGLSLLGDEPNYRASMPTKVIEYMSRGVPVISTPLPLPQRLIEDTRAGLVVPFGDGLEAAEAVLTLWKDPDLRHRMASAGRAAVQAHYDWASQSPRFVGELHKLIRGASSAGEVETSPALSEHG